MKMTSCFLRMILSVSILILLGSIHSYAEEVRGVTETTIKIGAIPDMTGPLATATIQIAEGKRNYTRYINDKGGINGRKVVILIEDDRYSIPMGIAAFKKLVSRDEIFAIMGPYNMGTLKALFGQFEKLKIPNVFAAPLPSAVNPLKRHMFATGEFYADNFGVIF